MIFVGSGFWGKFGICVLWAFGITTGFYGYFSGFRLFKFVFCGVWVSGLWGLGSLNFGDFIFICGSGAVRLSLSVSLPLSLSMSLCLCVCVCVFWFVLVSGLGVLGLKGFEFWGFGVSALRGFRLFGLGI